jgi:hypothetical protein
MLSSFNMHLNNKLAIFNILFFLKHVDPLGFHIPKQLVTISVEKINQLLKSS